MDAIRRASIGFGILVVVWIAVYWWWQPTGKAIAFDPEAAEARVSPGLKPPESSRPTEPPPPVSRAEPPAVRPPEPAIVPEAPAR